MPMDSLTPISPARRPWAIGLGMITVLCTLGLFLSFVVMSFELKRVGYDAPPFYPGIIVFFALVLTLPPALICTGISLFLVGPRRSKLAWISLSIYFLPIVIGLVVHLWKKFVATQ